MIFSSNRGDGAFNLYSIPSDGSGTAQRLTQSANTHYPGSWSPDGKRLALVEAPTTSPRELLTLALDADAPLVSEPVTPESFLATPFLETRPMFSPDGRFLACESNESGQREIYVRPFPGPWGKWQVSTGGGAEPKWSPKGGEIFYLNGERMMAASYSIDGDALRPETPRELFSGRFVSRLPWRSYDVFPDGEHFVMLQAPDGEPPEVVYIVNWSQELARLVPNGTN